MDLQKTLCHKSETKEQAQNRYNEKLSRLHVWWRGSVRIDLLWRWSVSVIYLFDDILEETELWRLI